MAADDPFELLGIPRRFDVDQAAMQAAYLKQTAALHPDRITDPIEQADAAAKAARLNGARSTLADDEQRANALLTLLGGPAKEDEKALPDGFLMQIMEVRQEMDDALASGDPDRRRRIEQWAQAQRSADLKRLSDLFADALTSPDPAVLREIRVQLNALRYVERMIEQLDAGHDAAL